MAWEDGGEMLVLRAACQLPAGVLLNGAVLLVGSDADRLVLTEGPESLAMLDRMTSGVFKKKEKHQQEGLSSSTGCRTFTTLTTRSTQ